MSVHQGVRLTYAQFQAAVTEVARGLLALGVDAGERVGIWSPTVTGKVQKFKMRQTSVAELGLQDSTNTRTA